MPLQKIKLDTKAILKHLHVSFIISGKNVGETVACSVCCPYCDDDGYHCGVWPEGSFSCWCCQESGNLFKLLHKTSKISWSEFHVIIAQFTKKPPAKKVSQHIRDIIKNKHVVEKKSSTDEIDWPEFSRPITSKTKSKLLKQYLKRRNYTLSDCVNYRCQLVEAGKYMNRMIIPVFSDSKLVAWQAVALTKAITKYLTKGLINQYLYNWDVARRAKTLYVVEGVFDVWRLNKVCQSSLIAVTCSFGAHCTNKQLRLIINSNAKEVVIMWDSDRYFASRKLVDHIVPFKRVRTIALPRGEDPDSLGKKSRQFLHEKILPYLNTTDHNLTEHNQT